MEEKYKEEFERLNDYAEELRNTNVGSTIIVLSKQAMMGSRGKMFDRMYICFKALKEGFLYGCRPLIGLDGCFLKGLIKGQLLVAIGRDENNQMFLIAWAVVDRENTETWSWFIEQLSQDLNLRDGLGWAFISDMQKGLIKSVREILLMVEQRMCARHIYARWGKTNTGKDLQLQFWITARSPNEPDLRKQLDIMAAMDKGMKAKEDLLEKWPVEGWCQAFFSEIIKADVIDNNMCETFNGVILEARCKPIIGMLEEIRLYVMRRLVQKREHVIKWKTDFAPRQLEKIEKYRKLSAKWEVEWNGSGKHEVYWVNQEKQKKESYTVRLVQHSCSCRLWDISGVPCAHAMAAIIYEGADPLTYLSSYFTKETYMRAYQQMLVPVKGQLFWPKNTDGPLMPPIVKRMPGRPAKKRKREPLEGKNKSKVSRKGRVMKCSHCHETGHNKTGCPRKKVIESCSGKEKKERKNNVEKGSDKVAASSIGQQHAHSISILNPGRRGSLIVGREVVRPPSAITTRQLIQQRNDMLARITQQQPTGDITPISTQQSSSSRKGKEKIVA